MYSLKTNDKGYTELSGSIVHQNVTEIEDQAILILNSQQQMTLCLSNINHFDNFIFYCCFIIITTENSSSEK